MAIDPLRRKFTLPTLRAIPKTVLRQPVEPKAPAKQDKVSAFFDTQDKLSSSLRDTARKDPQFQQSVALGTHQGPQRFKLKKFFTSKENSLDRLMLTINDSDFRLKQNISGLASGQPDPNVGLNSVLDDDEKDTLRYFYGKGDYGSIESFLKSIDHKVNARTAEGTQKNLARVANEGSIGEKLLLNLGSFGSAAVQGVGLAETGVQSLKNLVTGDFKPVDPNSPFQQPANITRQIRQGAVQDFGVVGQFAGNLAFSAGDMLINAGLLGGVGTPALGQAPSVLGGLLPSASLGLQAGGATAADALQRGATPEQAFTLGGTAGSVEALTEMIPLGRMLNAAGGGLRGLPLKQVIAEVLKTTAIEATQETISEYANTLTDIAVMGDRSQHALYRQSLIDSGMDPEEATKQTHVEFFLKQPGQAALGGAILGGVLGGGGALAGGPSNAQQQTQQVQTQQNVPRETQIQPQVQPIQTIAQQPQAGVQPQQQGLQQPVTQPFQQPIQQPFQQPQISPQITPQQDIAQDLTIPPLDTTFADAQLQGVVDNTVTEPIQPNLQPKTMVSYDNFIDEFNKYGIDNLKNDGFMFQIDKDAKSFMNYYRNAYSSKETGYKSPEKNLSTKNLFGEKGEALRKSMVKLNKAFASEPKLSTTIKPQSVVNDTVTEPNLALDSLETQALERDISNVAIGRTVDTEIKQTALKNRQQVADFNNAVKALRNTDTLDIKDMSLSETIQALEDYSIQLEQQAETGQAIQKPSIGLEGLRLSDVETIGRAMANKRTAVSTLRKLSKEMRGRAGAELVTAQKDVVNIIKQERSRKGNKLNPFQTLMFRFSQVFDLEALRISPKKQLELESVRDFYKETNLEVPLDIQQTISRLDKRSVSDLTPTEIEDIKTVIEVAKRADIEERKQMKQLNGITESENIESTKQAMPQGDYKPMNPAKRAVIASNSPITNAKALQGFGDTGYYSTAVRPVQAGIETRGVNNQWINENVYEDVKKLDVVKKAPQQELLTEKQYDKLKKVTDPTLGYALSEQELISLYMTSKDSEGFKRLISEPFYEAHIKNVSHETTESQLREFQDNFIKRYPELFQVAQQSRKGFDYYREKINQTQLYITGRPLITTETRETNPEYYPIRVQNYRVDTAELNKLSAGDFGFSFLKQRQGGRPIQLTNAVATIKNQLDKSNRYVSFASPVYDARNITEGVKTELQSQGTRGNKTLYDTWNKYYDDVAQGYLDLDSQGTFIRKVRSNLAASALSMRINVMAYQIASYPAALTRINLGNLIQATVTPTTKAHEARAVDINPMFYDRWNSGESTIELGQISPAKKIFKGRGIQFTDKRTTLNIARAADIQIGKENPSLDKNSDEYKSLTRKLVQDTIWETQPMFDVAFRSDLQRTKSEIAQFALMFSTQRYQLQNMVKQSIGYAKSGDLKTASRYMTGFVTSTIMFAAIKAGWDRLRGKDDELTKEDITATSMQAAMDSVFPLVSRLVSSIGTFTEDAEGNRIFKQGFEYDNLIDSTINDLIRGIASGVKQGTGQETTATPLKSIKDILSPIAELAGIPIDTLVEYADITARAIDPTFDKSELLRKDFDTPGTQYKKYEQYISDGTLSDKELARLPELKAKLPDSASKAYDTYVDLLEDGITPEEQAQIPFLERYANSTLPEATYSEKIKSLTGSLGTRMQTRLEKSGMTEEQAKIRVKAEKSNLEKQARDFFSNSLPKNELPTLDNIGVATPTVKLTDTEQSLMQKFVDTGDKTFLIEAFNTFTEKDIEYNVTPQENAEIQEEAIAEVEAITSEVGFEKLSRDGQNKIITNTINAVITDAKQEIILREDPTAFDKVKVPNELTAFYRTAEYDDSPIVAPLVDLFNQTANSGVLPKVTDSFSSFNIIYDLDQDDKDLLVSMTEQYVSAVVDNPNYQNASTENQEIAVSKMIQDSYNDFKRFTVQNSLGATYSPEVITELTELRYTFNDSSVLPKVTNEFSKKNIIYELDDTEKELQAKSQELAISTVMQSQRYQNADAEGKAELVSDQIQEAYNQLKDYIIKNS